MIEAAVLTYGLMTSFVLSGATRNRKLRRNNPAMLEGVGWVLCGASMGASAMLFYGAATGSLIA